MPYTIEQARKKAKGIVKVQISVGSQQVFPDFERAVLIYDEKYKQTNGEGGIMLTQPLTQGVDEAMGSALKRYFYYKLNKKFGKKPEIELLHEAPPQKW